MPPWPSAIAFLRIENACLMFACLCRACQIALHNCPDEQLPTERSGPAVQDGDDDSDVLVVLVLGSETLHGLTSVLLSSIGEPRESSPSYQSQRLVEVRPGRVPSVLASHGLARKAASEEKAG